MTIVHHDVFKLLDLDSGNCMAVCLDSHTLGTYVHAPHYILLLAKCPKTFKIFDPWTGKVSHVSRKKIVQGIEQLGGHLKYSQLAIYQLNNTVLKNT